MKVKTLSKMLLALTACGLVTSSIAQTPNLQTPNPKRHHFAIKSDKNSITGSATPNAAMVSGGIPLTAENTQGLMTLQDETWDPKFNVPPHFHKTHAEVFYIIDGQVEWTVSGETHVLGAGEVVYIPPGAVHSVKVVGGKPVRTLMIYTPGGYEDAAARRKLFTEAQLKDPVIRAELDKMNDFNLAK